MSKEPFTRCRRARQQRGNIPKISAAFGHPNRMNSRTSEDFLPREILSSLHIDNNPRTIDRVPKTHDRSIVRSSRRLIADPSCFVSVEAKRLGCENGFWRGGGAG